MHNGKKITGRIEIPNFSEEHEDLKDVDIECSVGTNTVPDFKAFWVSIRNGNASQSIRKLLRDYVDMLRSEFSAGVVLPTEGAKDNSTVRKSMNKAPEVKVAMKERRRPKNKSNYWSSGDLVFYASLISIVGISSVLVIKLARL